MRKSNWTRRDPIKNYFPLPNEIYSLGLSAGAIAVYGFLMRIENRQTYQCTASYRTIGHATGMSVNTVRKWRSWRSGASSSRSAPPSPPGTAASSTAVCATPSSPSSRW